MVAEPGRGTSGAVSPAAPGSRVGWLIYVGDTIRGLMILDGDATIFP